MALLIKRCGYRTTVAFNTGGSLRTRKSGRLTAKYYLMWSTLVVVRCCRTITYLSPCRLNILQMLVESTPICCLITRFQTRFSLMRFTQTHTTAFKTQTTTPIGTHLNLQATQLISMRSSPSKLSLGRTFS